MSRYSMTQATLLRAFLLSLGVATSLVGQVLAAPADLKPSPALQRLHPETEAILDVTRAGSRLVAVGEHGVIILSDDQGASYRQAKSVPFSATLTAVSFVDEHHGWAVGQWGAILATEDGGETWALQRSDTTTDQPLFSVALSTAQTGVAVGLWSLMLRTTDGGKSWTELSLPPAPGHKRADLNLTHVFTAPDGSLYVTAEQGILLRSQDQGVSWTYLQSGYRGTFWTGLVAHDGTLLAAGLRGSLYRSTDSGEHWQAVPTGTTASITSLIEVGNQIVGSALEGALIVGDLSGASFASRDSHVKSDLTGLVLLPKQQLMLGTSAGLAKADLPTAP